MTFISIICPIYNEAGFIARCIDSVLESDYAKDSLELLLVDGMSNDGTRDIIAQYTRQYPFIRLLDNPQKIVPYALNQAIRESKGDVVVRIDAHSQYPKNYFSLLVKKLFELDADNVGCPCRTLPANETTTAKAIAIAMSCSFGMGNSQFRIGATKEMKVDTVPFGCFRKELFDRIGYFDEELVRNQDDEFNGRIIKNGGKIYLIPELTIDYHARATLRKTSRMFYQYGLFKPLVNKKLGKPATLRQFFPPLFVSGLVIGTILSFFCPLLRCVFLTILSLYLFLSLYFGVKSSNKISEILTLVGVFATIHASYGTGYIVGLFRILFRKKFQVEVNR